MNDQPPIALTREAILSGKIHNMIKRHASPFEMRTEAERTASLDAMFVGEPIRMARCTRNLLGDTGTAEDHSALQQQGPQPGASKIRRADQPVMTAANDDSVVIHHLSVTISPLCPCSIR